MILLVITMAVFTTAWKIQRWHPTYLLDGHRDEERQRRTGRGGEQQSLDHR